VELSNTLGENIIKFCASFILIITFVFADMTPHGFDPYLNRYFVETGSYKGYGIQQAIDAGFQIIYSIDIDPECVQNCKNKFVNNPNIHIFLGDSGKDIFKIIECIDEPITFWLDGHVIFPKPNVKNTPLMDELEQIKQHKIKTHTILIDDLHCCGTPLFDYLSLEDIVAKLLEINPDYVISFTGGWVEGSDHPNVLAATVKKDK
jgi:hypothetical protein